MMAWFLTESKPCPWSTTAEALPQRSWRCPPEIVEVFYTRFQNGLHSGRLGSGSVVVFPATCSWYFLPPVPGISCQFLVFLTSCSWYFLPAVPGISYHLFLVFLTSCSWYFLPPVPGISYQLFLVFLTTCSWYFLPAVPGISYHLFLVFPTSCVHSISCQLYSVAGKEFNLHRCWHHPAFF